MQKFLQRLFLGLFLLSSVAVMAQKSELTHNMSEDERGRIDEIGRNFVETDPPTGEVRPVAEFEPMEAVLVRYPFGIPMTLIASLSEEITVTTIVTGQSQENTVLSQYESNGVNTDNCNFVYAPTDTYWTRDYGPWFIEYGDNQFGIVDFPYNRPRPGDDDFPIVIADSLNLELFGMDLIQTGGNYMADGISMAASTELVIEENPTQTEEEIKQKMADYMGVSTYHINDDPLGDYIKHIDCWGKFLDVDKVLIAEVPESDPRYDDYEAVVEYYENATCGWGTPYNVIRVYAPGDYPYTPYSNTLIVNNRVFIPLTGSEWDDEAIATYEEAMPGYEIIGINYDGWMNTDALHCRTHEIVDRGMLRIKHTPTLGDVDQQNDYIITADIIPHSGETVYADSIRVYYKFNTDEQYTSIIMDNVSGDTYQATISVTDEVSDVYYYIHAADESGRSENHPYIGAPDPHDFHLEASVSANISISTNNISTTCQVDETAEESFVISNTGEANLNYNTEINYIDGSDWMTIDPVSGIIAPASQNDISANFDATGLAIGTYTAELLINSNDPNNAQEVINVTFDVSVNTSDMLTAFDNLKISPNPFKGAVAIEFVLQTNQTVNIRVFDINGKLVKQINNSMISGKHTIHWDGTNNSGNELENGIYFINLKTDNKNVTKRIIKL
ncbi:MAG: agmatine deiminase family protein [Bacteroidota bacterium]|nr:agmatine deiminase family protein [Bacteroidota bacterium]